MKKIVAIAAVSAALVLAPAGAALAYSDPAGPNTAAPNSVVDYTFTGVPGDNLNVSVTGPGTVQLSSLVTRVYAVSAGSATVHVKLPSETGTYVLTGSNSNGFSSSLSISVSAPTSDSGVQLTTHALSDASDPNLAATGLDAAPYIGIGSGALVLGAVTVGLVAWRRRSARQA